jgi:hypothetical protein
MKNVDERTAANMEVALEQVCRALHHGGDHETRKRIAKKLIGCARHGSTTLGDFMAVARSALHEISFANRRNQQAIAGRATSHSPSPGHQN